MIGSFDSIEPFIRLAASPRMAFPMTSVTETVVVDVADEESADEESEGNKS